MIFLYVTNTQGIITLQSSVQFQVKFLWKISNLAKTFQHSVMFRCATSVIQSVPLNEMCWTIQSLPVAVFFFSICHNFMVLV